MTGKLLSVMTPIYNDEKHLRNTLDSLFSAISPENEQFVEFLFINDGSTDKTDTILQEYSLKYPFKYITQKNQGCTATYNNLIKAASGQYIYIFDHDDLFEKSAIDKIIACLQKDPDIDLLIFDNYEETISPDGNNKLRFKTRGWKSRKCDGQSVFAAQNKQGVYTAAIWYRVMRRALLIDNNIYFRTDFVWGDLEFTPRLYSVMKKVAHLPEPLYRYMIYNESLSHNNYKTPNYTRLCMSALDSLSKFIDTRKDLTKEFIDALHNAMGNIYWAAIDGIKPNGIFDNTAIEQLSKYFQYSKFGKANRKYIYRWLVKFFGIKRYYNLRYRN